MALIPYSIGRYVKNFALRGGAQKNSGNKSLSQRRSELDHKRSANFTRVRQRNSEISAYCLYRRIVHGYVSAGAVHGPLCTTMRVRQRKNSALGGEACLRTWHRFPPSAGAQTRRISLVPGPALIMFRKPWAPAGRSTSIRRSRVRKLFRESLRQKVEQSATWPSAAQRGRGRQARPSQNPAIDCDRGQSPPLQPASWAKPAGLQRPARLRFGLVSIYSRHPGLEPTDPKHPVAFTLRRP